MCFFVAMPVADVFHKLFQYPPTATEWRHWQDYLFCVLPAFNKSGRRSICFSFQTWRSLLRSELSCCFDKIAPKGFYIILGPGANSTDHRTQLCEHWWFNFNAVSTDHRTQLCEHWWFNINSVSTDQKTQRCEYIVIKILQTVVFPVFTSKDIPLIARKKTED